MDSNMQHYKYQIQNVIENLKKLENIQFNDSENLKSNEISEIVAQTTELLNNLEEAPTQKIKKLIEKRKRKRQKAKLRRKMKNDSKPRIATKNVPEAPTNTLNKLNTNSISVNPTQKPHQQLRSYRDASRFLRTFELLEKLHAARSQDESATRNFATKLSKLRSIWNIILFENKPDFTAAQNIEDQWNIVHFGTPEKSFYKQKKSVAELINIRRKWDSYITNDTKLGTTIPACWVLPPENPDERWQRYKAQ